MKKNEVQRLKSKIIRLEKDILLHDKRSNKYLDMRDELIKNKRDLAIRDGHSVNENNLYTTNHTVYIQDTGHGLTGQK